MPQIRSRRCTHGDRRLGVGGVVHRKYLSGRATLRLWPRADVCGTCSETCRRVEKYTSIVDKIKHQIW